MSESLSATFLIARMLWRFLELLLGILMAPNPLLNEFVIHYILERCEG